MVKFAWDMNSFNEQVIFHAAHNKSTDEVHDTSIFSCLLIQYVDHCVVITVECDAFVL